MADRTPHNPFVGLERHDPIDKKKGVAMREDLLDAFYLNRQDQGAHGKPTKSIRPRRVGCLASVPTTNEEEFLTGSQVAQILPAVARIESVLHPEALLPAIAIENATLHRRHGGMPASWPCSTRRAKRWGRFSTSTRCALTAEVVHRVVDYEMFAIFLVDEEANELVLKTSRQMTSIAPRRRIALSEGLTGAAARSKEPVIVGDVRDDPRYTAVEPEVRSELVVPLVHKGRVVGVFDLESRELNRFTHEHIKVLTPLASQVAVASKVGGFGALSPCARTGGRPFRPLRPR